SIIGGMTEGISVTCGPHPRTLRSKRCSSWQERPKLLTPFFSVTFLLYLAKYLCFHIDSGFAGEFSTPVLCFHTHSSFGPSILKNSFLVLPQIGTSCPSRIGSVCGL